MEPQDDKLERYLAEFHPRAVRTLHLSPRARNPWQRRLAVAAAVLCCIGTGYWQIHRVRVKALKGIQLKSQTMVMTRIGLQNSEKLDEFLFDQSRNVLPSFQGDQSTLRVLAKE
jgi:hypothetical protein